MNDTSDIPTPQDEKVLTEQWRVIFEIRQCVDAFIDDYIGDRNRGDASYSPSSFLCRNIPPVGLFISSDFCPSDSISTVYQPFIDVGWLYFIEDLGSAIIYGLTLTGIDAALALTLFENNATGYGPHDPDTGSIQTPELFSKLWHSVNVQHFPNRVGYVYLLRMESGEYKIGRTRSLDKRITQISPQLPYAIRLIHTIETADCVALEGELHALFSDKRLRGEWFNLTSEDVEYIQGLP